MNPTTIAAIPRWIAEGRYVICAPDVMPWLKENLPEIATLVQVNEYVAPGKIYGLDLRPLNDQVMGWNQPENQSQQ